MDGYVLDTGILVNYIRGSDLAKKTESRFHLFDESTYSYISVVSVGEIYSLAKQLRWGVEKQKLLLALLREIPWININSDKILDSYAEIDFYSLNKNSGKKLPSQYSAIQMGKNDLWIAATASVLNCSLITLDNDFNHLDGSFLDVIHPS